MLRANPELAKQVEQLQNFNPAEAQEKIGKAFKAWAANEQIKIHAELLNWAIRERFSMLSTVSALASTLLIVATFNNELIILDNFVRALLSVLLFLIPAGLWGLFYETGEAQKESLKHVKEIMEKNIGKEAAAEVEKLQKKRSFRGLMPFLINAIFTIVVFLVIVLIWKRI